MTVTSVGEVWADLVGQDRAIAELDSAATDPAAMTHAWLFTGPPGSGRSVAARAFAAALQCPEHGCGHCQSCRTVLAGTHSDVREVVPEGLSISVSEMRALVQIAARRPSTGGWQIVVIADADRLTEGAANALLKAVEEPSARTVFLLCAPSDHPDDVPVTIRSRCRLVPLRTPPAEAIAAVLSSRDGVDPEIARWAASVCGGHVGRARRLARDPDARARREQVLALPLSLRGFGEVFTAADHLIGSAEAEAADVAGSRDAAEREALSVAMGAGGTGKGVAAAQRGAKAAERELERRQKSRATRSQRDALDRALVDLAGFYRDVLAARFGASVPATHPDRAQDVHQAAASWSPESTLRRLEAVLSCREALELNVKPRIAVEAMLTVLHRG
ncbi:MAG TPA: DNA polymerase III subunit delta' [Pseudonocardia sp.]|uniref:DNA polymerase III subunit delta' n=1 Tax=Pseudonocardia sp. TaxID=60912 RepID=UPI002C59A95A|nr:DNA polymerase III subunit delta' [Pseudonocardia sp.]HTF50083.1 DNA polymerase III subunit delta' [Pseudonocardia sp.]